MADALAYEKADELGNPIKRLTASSNKSATSATVCRPRKQGKVKQHQVSATVNVPADIVTVSSDDEDLSYVARITIQTQVTLVAPLTRGGQTRFALTR